MSIERIPYYRDKQGRQKRNDQFYHMRMPLLRRLFMHFIPAYDLECIFWMYILKTLHPFTSFYILLHSLSNFHTSSLRAQLSFINNIQYSPIFPGITSNWAGASLTKIGRLHNSCKKENSLFTLFLLSWY